MKSIRNLVFAAATAIGVSLSATTASAVPLITFAYEGIVDISPGGGFDAFLGQTVRYEFTFDAATSDSSPADANFGAYRGAITNALVTIGTTSYTGVVGAAGIIGGIFVFDNRGLGDQYTSNAILAGPSVDGFPVLFASLNLRDSTETAFSNDALPLTLPNPALFNFGPSIELHFGNADGDEPIVLASSAVGQVVSTTIPEPASLVLFTVGLFGLYLVASPRRRRELAISNAA